jgi:K+-transporting ATPase KdpF subunit
VTVLAWLAVALGVAALGLLTYALIRPERF